MKLLLLLLSLSTANAFSQIIMDQEVVMDSTLVYMENLNCVLPQGRAQDIYTEINDLRVDNIKEVKMEHRNARVKGCDTEALDSLSQDSTMRFGFLDVNVRIVKGVSRNPRMVLGKCQKNYSEQVFFEFNHGLTLQTSRLGKLIPATGC